MQTLVLVPTDVERLVLAPIVASALGHDDRLELCGFGPVAAAARTAALLARDQPARVLLVGIAGRLDDRLTIGAASLFEQVACFGIGVGSHDGFVPAAQLGWPQWPGDQADGSPVIGDVIACRTDRVATPGAELLLTACAASATAADVLDRRRLFPDAVAEDMEGFAVAFACRMAGVPLDIVRGISNVAGDRDHSRWQTNAALHAAGNLAVQMIARDS
jgi:futalosine hydrolase